MQSPIRPTPARAASLKKPVGAGLHDLPAVQKPSDHGDVVERFGLRHRAPRLNRGAAAGGDGFAGIAEHRPFAIDLPAAIAFIRREAQSIHESSESREGESGRQEEPDPQPASPGRG
ncbi:MAG: hypothetical protein WDO68_18400 [Gammaproteobacteria bacterium]